MKPLIHKGFLGDYGCILFSFTLILDVIKCATLKSLSHAIWCDERSIAIDRVYERSFKYGGATNDCCKWGYDDYRA